MKTILTLFFLATLTTTTTAATLSEEGVTVTPYFNGELCGSFDEVTAGYNGFEGGEESIRTGSIGITPGASIADTGRRPEGRTLQCETTLELTYPKGYRFYVVRPNVVGYMQAGPDFMLDVGFEVRAGMAQYQSFHSTVAGDPSKGEEFDLYFDNALRRELRSDCSGSAELVVTNTLTLRPTELRGPGEVDDVGMAFIEYNTLNLEWERCAPGEL